MQPGNTKASLGAQIIWSASEFSGTSLPTPVTGSLQMPVLDSPGRGSPVGSAVFAGSIPTPTSKINVVLPVDASRAPQTAVMTSSVTPSVWSPAWTSVKSATREVLPSSSGGTHYVYAGDASPKISAAAAREIVFQYQRAVQNGQHPPPAAAPTETAASGCRDASGEERSTRRSLSTSSRHPKPWSKCTRGSTIEAMRPQAKSKVQPSSPRQRTRSSFLERSGLNRSDAADGTPRSVSSSRRGSRLASLGSPRSPRARSLSRDGSPTSFPNAAPDCVPNSFQGLDSVQLAEKLPWNEIQAVRAYEKELRYNPPGEVEKDWRSSLRPD